MEAFDVLGDPVRRRILELLADGEAASGTISAAIQEEFGITQPAVSQHLKVLRETGFATVRPEGTRRFYAVRPAALQEVDMWLDHFRAFWKGPLDALATEIARGQRTRRRGGAPAEPTESAEERDVPERPTTRPDEPDMPDDRSTE